MDEMECREAIVKRLISKFRHEFGAPVRYDRISNGYILEQREGAKYVCRQDLLMGAAQIQTGSGPMGHHSCLFWKM